MARIASILALVCLACPVRVYAVRYPIDRLGHLDGVIVRDMFQDSLGFLWLATDNGLLRWEGTAFRRLHEFEGQSGPAHAIIEDDRGTLLIATDDGVVGIDSRTLSTHPDSPWIPGRAIRRLSLDRAGDVWAGGFPGLFHLKQTGNGFATEPDSAPVAGTEELYLYSLRRADDDSIWFGTRKCLYQIQDGLPTPMFVDQIEPSHVTAITFTKDGSIWVGTRSPGRLYRIRDEHAQRLEDPDGLDCTKVNVITELAGGGVWVGTEHGVYGWTDSGFMAIDRTNGLANDDIHALFVDRENQLWIGTFGGGAFRLLSPHVVIYGMEDGLPHTAITSLAHEADGSLLVGTANGVARFDAATGRASLVRQGCHALAVYTDSQGTSWVSDDSGVVRLSDNVTFEPAHGKCLSEDEFGRVVVGTGSGVTRLVAEESVLSVVLVPSATILAVQRCPDGAMLLGTDRGLVRVRDAAQETLFDESAVTAIAYDAKGRLILGTAGGLGWLKGDALELFEHRLPNRFTTHDLLLDHRGTLWAATDVGILRLDRGVVRRFGRNDGLPSEAVQAIVESSPGILYAGTTQGLARIDVDKLVPCDEAPIVWISRIMAGGHSAPLSTNEWNVPYADNDISVWTERLGFRSAEGAQSQFRLMGGDDTWSEPADASHYFYPHIPPGRYTLLARAIGDQGVVSETARVSFTVLRPYWQTMWFQASIVVLGLATLGLTGTMYRRRRQLRQVAEAAVRARGEFVSRMSHEIRTPLTVILACAETLSDAPLTVEAKNDCIATILKSGKHLLGVVNDVLDLSRINSQEMEIELIPCHVPELLSEVESIAAHKSTGKPIVVEMAIDSTVPTWIITDPTRLRQILINLLDNAVKFTDCGSVQLAASWTATPANVNGVLRLTVRDSGCGITNEKRDLVFGAFRQEDSSITRRYGGTGLGLTIAKSLTDLLGGTLTLDSRPDAGTTFTLELPVLPSDCGSELVPACSETEKASGRDLAGASVLIADDCDDLCRVTKTILGYSGADVRCVASGPDALECAKNHPFDVVLLDIHMPEMDGVATLKALRRCGIDTPCVAISADTTDETRRRCHRAGFDGFIAKPFDRGSLIDKLQRTIGAAKPDVGSAARGAAPPVIDEQLPLDDDGPILSTLAGQSTKLAEAAAEFVEALVHDMSRLDDALAARDTETLLDIAHRLKGSGGINGYMCISTMAAQIERHARHEAWPQVQTQIERLRLLHGRMADGFAETPNA